MFDRLIEILMTIMVQSFITHSTIRRPTLILEKYSDKISQLSILMLI